MNRQMKRILILLCLFVMGLSAAWAENEKDPLDTFILHHGDRNSSKIAITVDDCYKTATEWIARDAELCREHGIAMTFFPIVYTGCLEEKYRDLWQNVLDSGCEIGTHTYSHLKMGNRDAHALINALGKSQEALDRTLGYHYQIRWLRPPYGSVASGKKLKEQQVIKAVKKYGFDHIVHWEISETKSIEKVLKKIQNGSILLFHAKKRDTQFIEKLIPELKSRGFEMVTVSELFGFDPPETSEELYVYNKEDYMKSGD